MYGRKPQNRRATRVFLLVFALVWTIVGLVIGWTAFDEARGGVVDAEVVDVSHNSSGWRVYDVRFEAAGRFCSSRLDSDSNPWPRDIRIGGISRLQIVGGGRSRTAGCCGAALG